MTAARIIRAEALFIGGRVTGIVVELDLVWPGMWRIRHGDDLSDMANISRAKDAAIAWARPRGLGGGEVARWHHRESRAGAAQARFNGRAGTGGGAR